MTVDAEHLERMKRTVGPMARREARLAYSMLLPTFIIVFSIVLFPLLANFWISVKPVELGDLRAPEIVVRERIKGKIESAGDSVQLEYRLRNSSQDRPILAAGFHDRLPAGMTVTAAPDGCAVAGEEITCDVGDVAPGARDRIRFEVSVDQSYIDAGIRPRDTKAVSFGDADNVLTNLTFTLCNFAKVFSNREFADVVWVTIIYTVFGTLGALILGLFAAQLLNTSFFGRSVLRGLFLFPYVSPVIAVAFTWVFLLDPFSGTINALLVQMGATDSSINFLGQRNASFEIMGVTMTLPLALTTVIAFESWRYFPLAFLFILARMQSLPTDLNEAAEMDGATPLQKFFYIELPQLLGILAVLFLLRFIWTFNKFDDIFLLTGGASGTRTLTVDVYEQGFALANLGAGAAVSVVVFVMLAVFITAYFRLMPKEEGL